MTQIQLVENKLKINDYLKSDIISQSIEKALGEKSKLFTTSVLTLASANKSISECDPRSVYTACLTATTLELPFNANLGYAYIVPYKGQAQFQIGYKGLVQLALNTKEYTSIAAEPVYEGQLVGRDNKTKEPIFDFNIEDSGEPIGFMAYIELKDGYSKATFRSTESIKAHAKKYSQSFKKGYGVWVDEFEEMAKKTVLKLLLLKYGKLSIQLQTALVEDQKADGEYVDNKTSFEVEDATIGDEPIEVEAIENVPLGTEVEVVEEEPTAVGGVVTKEPLMTQARKRKAFAILGNLSDEQKAIAEEGRLTMLGKKSRSFYTVDEGEKWIAYLESFEGDNGQ